MAYSYTSNSLFPEGHAIKTKATPSPRHGNISIDHCKPARTLNPSFMLLLARTPFLAPIDPA